MDHLSLKILQHENLSAWLDSRPNTDSWALLYQACPWRLPFFSPEFFKLWSRHYGAKWNPLLVLARDQSGRLEGLMPLAEADGLLTGVGAQQAEYHGWLSRPDDAGVFLSAALQALFETFPSHRLHLRYLPPGLPEQCVTEVCRQFPRLTATVHARPLLKLDGRSIDKTLRKKGNKSKINRLRRLGELHFRKLVDGDEIEAHIDRIIALYDLRQGAVNDSTPFHDDPEKRPFLLDWARSSPDQLHISCMMLNGQVISAHIGVDSGSGTHLAILAHAPELAAFSPGKLQLYMTAQRLAQEGKFWLDLTPGGDPWKERFATDHDRVLELHACSSLADAVRKKVSGTLEGAIRELLAALHISPARQKSLISPLRRLNPAGIAASLRRLRPMRAACHVYRIDIDGWVPVPDVGEVKRNEMSHLVRYRQPPGGQRNRASLPMPSADWNSVPVPLPVAAAALSNRLPGSIHQR